MKSPLLKYLKNKEVDKLLVYLLLQGFEVFPTSPHIQLPNLLYPHTWKASVTILQNTKLMACEHSETRRLEIVSLVHVCVRTEGQWLGRCVHVQFWPSPPVHFEVGPQPWAGASLMAGR